MTGAILWQDCILCQCWHTVGQPHLAKGDIGKVDEAGVWWSPKGVPYLSRDKVRQSIANDVFEKVEREWGVWWSPKGVPYLSRDKVRQSIANDVFEKVEREWGKRMNRKRQGERPGE